MPYQSRFFPATGTKNSAGNSTGISGPGSKGQPLGLLVKNNVIMIPHKK